MSNRDRDGDRGGRSQWPPSLDQGGGGGRRRGDSRDGRAPAAQGRGRADSRDRRPPPAEQSFRGGRGDSRDRRPPPAAQGRGRSYSRDRRPPADYGKGGGGKRNREGPDHSPANKRQPDRERSPRRQEVTSTALKKISPSASRSRSRPKKKLGGGGGFDKKVMPEDLERVQEMARKLHQNKSVAHAFALHMEQARNQPVNPEVESLLAQYPSIQAHVAARLRALPRDAQAAVLIKGGLSNAREPSAVLLRRIQAVDPHNTTWVPMPRTPAGQRFPTHQELASHHGVIASMVPANSLAPIALGPRVEKLFVPPQMPEPEPVEEKKKEKDPEEDRDEEMDYALTMIADQELRTGTKAGSKEAKAIANMAASSASKLPGKQPMLSDWRRSRPMQGQEVPGQLGVPPVGENVASDAVPAGPVLPVGLVGRPGQDEAGAPLGLGRPPLQGRDDAEEEASTEAFLDAPQNDMPMPKAPGLYRRPGGLGGPGSSGGPGGFDRAPPISSSSFAKRPPVPGMTGPEGGGPPAKKPQVIMPTLPVAGGMLPPTRPNKRGSHGWDAPAVPAPAPGGSHGWDTSADDEVLESAAPSSMAQMIPPFKGGGKGLHSWEDPAGAEEDMDPGPMPVPKGGWQGQRRPGPAGRRDGTMKGGPFPDSLSAMPEFPFQDSFPAMPGGSFPGAQALPPWEEDEPEETPEEKAIRRAKHFAIPSDLANKKNNVQSSLASLAASLLGGEALELMDGEKGAGKGYKGAGKGSPKKEDALQFGNEAAFGLMPGDAAGFSMPSGSSAGLAGMPAWDPAWDAGAASGSSDPLAAPAAPEPDDGLTPEQKKVLENLRKQQAERERQEEEVKEKKKQAEQEAAVAAATNYQHYWIRQQMNSLMELYKNV